MTTRKLPLLALLLVPALMLGGCQSLEGQREGDIYSSPAAAYTIDLGINTFRGHVVLDERCDNTGGSTTFWDGNGRMFRIDYLQLENNPMVDAPRFASDLTLMNLVLNSYLRKVVANSDAITSAEAVHRELLDNTKPRSMFAIVSIQVNGKKLNNPHPGVSGKYYYGFLLFKKGGLMYVVQHRQPVLMTDKMKQVLLRLADAMTIPGKQRDDTEMERMKQMLVRLAPGKPPANSRLCHLGQT